jgi:hypothetical protein
MLVGARTVKIVSEEPPLLVALATAGPDIFHGMLLLPEQACNKNSACVACIFCMQFSIELLCLSTGLLLLVPSMKMEQINCNHSCTSGFPRPPIMV